MRLWAGWKHGEIKVHELMKVRATIKDMLVFTGKKGIEAKAAQALWKRDAAALVRKSLGHKSGLRGGETETPTPAEKEACEGGTGSSKGPPANKGKALKQKNKGQDGDRKEKKLSS